MKRLRALLLCMLLGALFVQAPTPALADFGLEETAKEITKEVPGFYKEGTEGTLAARIGNIIAAALTLIGVVFFGLVLYGGVLWMTARGNQDQASKALKTVFAAIIGIIIVLAAYAITSFVFDSVGPGKDGSTITEEQKEIDKEIDNALKEAGL